MSGVGFSELIILFLIGLIVLGPERLPRVANQLGNWLGQARRMTRVMKRQLEDEINLEQERSIKPGPSVQTPTYVKPAGSAADAYSPAHAPDSAGSGRADDAPLAAQDSDAAVAADEVATGQPGDAPKAS